jgi:hypothetical protein
MASYEEFEAWHRATSSEAGDWPLGPPVAEFGVQLIVGDDPAAVAPQPSNPEFSADADFSD